MSDRERWIVYPLLFFALIISFRNVSRRLGSASFNKIECNNLVVNEPSGDKRIHLKGTEDGGHFQLFGKSGHSLVTASAQYSGTEGRLEVGSANTRSKVALSGKENGATIHIHSHPNIDGVFPTTIQLGFDHHSGSIGLRATSGDHSATTYLAAYSLAGIEFKPIFAQERATSQTENKQSSPAKNETNAADDSDSKLPKEQAEKPAEKPAEETTTRNNAEIDNQ